MLICIEAKLHIEVVLISQEVETCLKVQPSEPSNRRDRIDRCGVRLDVTEHGGVTGSRVTAASCATMQVKDISGHRPPIALEQGRRALHCASAEGACSAHHRRRSSPYFVRKQDDLLPHLMVTGCRLAIRCQRHAAQCCERSCR